MNHFRRAVGCLVLALTGCSRPPTTPASSPVRSPIPSLARGRQAETLTIGQIVSSFEDNAVTAEDYLKGREVQVRGKLLDIGSLEASSWAIAIAPEDAEPTTDKPAVAFFWFDAGTRGLAGDLHTGENVICRGTFRDREAHQITDPQLGPVEEVGLNFVGAGVQPSAGMNRRP